MTIKNGDFVKIEYTGKLTDSGVVFDTTKPDVAKENKMDNDAKLEPKCLCVGQKHILGGLDAELPKHTVGEEFTVELSPEDAFGKKSAKLIQLIATNKFKKQGINPQPGLSVNIDNQMGLIKSVSGGRTLVDFNHPLSGKEVTYTVKIIEKVDDVLEQTTELLKIIGGLPPVKVEFAGEDKTAVKVTMPQALPDPFQKALSEKITELVKLKKVDFVIGKE